MDVARRIRDIMTDRDIKIRAMAKKIHVGEGTLGAYLRGERTTPYDILVQLADELEISADYIMGRTDVPGIPLRLSDFERSLILGLRTLDPKQKELAGQVVMLMAEQNRR